MPQQKILIVIAYTGYQPIEYQIPKKTLEQAGFKVITASNKLGTATASNGSQTNIDLTLEQASAQDYAAIIFVGGPGTLDNLDNPKSYQLINQVSHLGILIGAICIAPRILASAGILSNVAATGWDDDNQLTDIYNEYGAIYYQVPVVNDQRIITANGPHAAQEFADMIVSELNKK